MCCIIMVIQKVTVQAGDVAWMRKGGRLPFLAAAQPYMVPGIAVGIVVVILLVIGVRLRRSRRQHKS